MTNLSRMIVVAVLLAFVGGCATFSGREHRLLCAVIGGVVGGTLGAVAGQDDEEEIAVAGGVVGAGLGYLACADSRKTAYAAPVDSDGDGVYDDADACPNTPRGARVDARGCPLDSDGDGVFDGLDRCPGTPAGARVDANGCPLDSDGDGVPDFRDECPGTTSGLTVNDRGCPVAGQVMLRLEGVNFEFDKATLTSEAQARLAEAVTILNANAGVRVRVEGHADARGTDEYNQALSERRAASVVTYLTSMGIAGNRMQSQGFGESQPVAPNDTEENMARNRRVDFVVID